MYHTFVHIIDYQGIGRCSNSIHEFSDPLLEHTTAPLPYTFEFRRAGIQAQLPLPNTAAQYIYIQQVIKDVRAQGSH